MISEELLWIPPYVAGGEYGEDWHKAGNLTNKQNVFNDFAACAQYLIQHKYTSTAKLGMLGGSNGGLLMGAMITQHQHVVQSTKYPAILLTAGLNDGRVAPSNSFKFCARLQAAAAPGNPILLTINSFGHGIGSSLDQQVEDITDVLSFFAYELGVNRS
jgi:prolyl oligopeptidase